MIGTVYLILEVDSHGFESHKIGITNRDVNKRLRELQTGNSNKLSVLKCYESKNYNKVEGMLHAKYSYKQTLSMNEFFKLSDDEVIKFLDTCKKLDETITLLLNNNPFFN